MKRILLDVNILLDAVFGVAPVSQATLQRALTLGWTDFEDPVCAASAEAAGCDLIVTRDPADFPASPVQTVDPATALALLEREGGTGRLSEPRRAPYATGRRSAPGRTRRMGSPRVSLLS